MPRLLSITENVCPRTDTERSYQTVNTTTMGAVKIQGRHYLIGFRKAEVFSEDVFICACGLEFKRMASARITVPAPDDGVA